MAEKFDPRQVVTFEEVLTNEEVLEEIKAVRQEMEGNRGARRMAYTVPSNSTSTQTPRVPSCPDARGNYPALGKGYHPLHIQRPVTKSTARPSQRMISSPGDGSGIGD